MPGHHVFKYKKTWQTDSDTTAHDLVQLGMSGIRNSLIWYAGVTTQSLHSTLQLSDRTSVSTYRTDAQMSC